MRFIKPTSLQDDSFILDVRSLEEHQLEELKLPHIHKSLADLDPCEFMQENQTAQDKTINIICASGARASQAAEMFEKAGLVFEGVAREAKYYDGEFKNKRIYSILKSEIDKK